MKKFLLITFILVLSGCMTAPELSDADRYFDEVSNIKDQNSDADFTNLRMVYTNTRYYKPFGGKEKLMLDTMFGSIQKNDFEVCVDQAIEILDSNYASLNAHYAAMSCYYKMGEREDGAYHRYVLDGLMESISNSGDGGSKETAYIIISPSEMKAFLDLKGMAVRKRKLDRDRQKGRAYNVMTVTDGKGRRKTLYFDVTLQMAKGI